MTGATPAIDEGIEHQLQKLIHHLERSALGAGRRFAVDLRQLGRSECAEHRRDAAGRIEVVYQRIGE
jgi:hypothetical protein